MMKISEKLVLVKIVNKRYDFDFYLIVEYVGLNFRGFGNVCNKIRIYS